MVAEEAMAMCTTAVNQDQSRTCRSRASNHYRPAEPIVHARMSTVCYNLSCMLLLAVAGMCLERPSNLYVDLVLLKSPIGRLSLPSQCSDEYTSTRDPAI